jgi:CBS domain-containing protein
MTDGVDEELDIMEERASEPPAIRADLLEEPIRVLCDKPAVTIDVTGTVAEAVRQMQERRFGSLLVLDGTTLAGIVTERDVLYEVAGADPAILARPVTEIMTPDPETLQLDDPIVFLMNKMHVGRFRHVPILSEAGEPKHVISLRDVLRWMLEHFGSVVTNLPASPFRGAHEEYGG